MHRRCVTTATAAVTWPSRVHRPASRAGGQSRQTLKTHVPKHVVERELTAGTCDDSLTSPTARHQVVECRLLAAEGAADGQPDNALSPLAGFWIPNRECQQAELSPGRPSTVTPPWPLTCQVMAPPSCRVAACGSDLVHGGHAGLTAGLSMRLCRAGPCRLAGRRCWRTRTHLASVALTGACAVDGSLPLVAIMYPSALHWIPSPPRRPS